MNTPATPAAPVPSPRDLAGRPVADLRVTAKALRTAPAAEHTAILGRLAASAVPEARCVAGYAAAWFVLRHQDDDARSLVDPLVGDGDWTVREAATFGVREALVADAGRVLPLVRRWAAEDRGDREHRAFLVVARQPKRQKPSAVEELIRLLRVPLADDGPYVRKNVPFCLRYLARTHPHVLAPALREWSAADDRWLSRACVTALTGELLAAEPHTAAEVARRLRRSGDDWTVRRLPALQEPPVPTATVGVPLGSPSGVPLNSPSPGAE
ncbi:DNA alkylation repair protein [Streptomyces sp. NPDC055025]